MSPQVERTAIPDPEFYDRVVNEAFRSAIHYGEGLRHPLWAARNHGFEREVHYVGAENLHEQTGAFILAPVHRNFIDPMVVADALDREDLRVNMMAKQDIWDWPVIGGFVGRVLDRGGTFPIKRGRWLHQETIDLMAEIFGKNGIMGMFPEEHRRTGDIVHREHMKLGVAAISAAFRIPVLPVGIDGTEKTKRGDIEVVFGKAIPVPEPAGFDISDISSVNKVKRAVLNPYLDRIHEGMQVVQNQAIERRVA